MKIESIRDFFFTLPISLHSKQSVRNVTCSIKQYILDLGPMAMGSDPYVLHQQILTEEQRAIRRGRSRAPRKTAPLSIFQLERLSAEELVYALLLILCAARIDAFLALTEADVKRFADFFSFTLRRCKCFPENICYTIFVQCNCTEHHGNRFCLFHHPVLNAILGTVRFPVNPRIFRKIIRKLNTSMNFGRRSAAIPLMWMMYGAGIDPRWCRIKAIVNLFFMWAQSSKQ